jgi:hypothetical protein
MNVVKLFFHSKNQEKESDDVIPFSQYEPESLVAEKIWRSSTQELIDSRLATVKKYLADLERLQRWLNRAETYREVVEIQDKLLALDQFYFQEFLENHPAYKSDYSNDYY